MAVEAATTYPAIQPARAAALAGTIRQASSATGVSFGYLVAAAKIESNLNPQAAAPNSSARGLYQFIEQTWLGTVKEAGAPFGYGRYADAITRLPSGRYEVSDAAMQREILELRKDPAANAAMAGVLTRSNSFKLTGALGRRPSDGELYIAHFLGAGGATRLISSVQNNPQADAAQMFPRAAAANPAIFYGRSGHARTVSQVHAELTGRYSIAANSSAARSLLAAGGAPTNFDAQSIAQAGQTQRLAMSTDISEAESRQLGIAERNSRFHSMFQAGERGEPVASVVRELWANGSSSSTNGIASDVRSVPTTPNGQPAAAREGLDLFSDRYGVFGS
ncbi:transglycosylase SLT domain-containing protein [Bradyrhizobium sp. LHD-71]|uniref:transglycosylase SLT domain-containing protein n=1 Tax=Bradyrhizobium sp. LHD-71 TaxID=3072141 RepID=UPI00280C97AA|nr:transglycosylase SLT domain-containing protein [Bradyrhizobium sp. LHD-71]MDQ8726549.1 transglycosylase SLT domain-containing protein [Bradyrhizobium sp. LHD-71]